MKDAMHGSSIGKNGLLFDGHSSKRFIILIISDELLQFFNLVALEKENLIEEKRFEIYGLDLAGTQDILLKHLVVTSVHE